MNDEILRAIAQMSEEELATLLPQKVLILQNSEGDRHPGIAAENRKPLPNRPVIPENCSMMP